MTDAQIKALRTKRAGAKYSLTTYTNFLNNFDSENEVPSLERRFREIEVVYTKFKSYQHELEGLLDESEELFSHRTAFEESFYNAFNIATSLLAQHAKNYVPPTRLRGSMQNLTPVQQNVTSTELSANASRTSLLIGGLAKQVSDARSGDPENREQLVPINNGPDHPANTSRGLNYHNQQHTCSFLSEDASPNFYANTASLLSTISLPTFNDAYDAWLGCRDLFHSHCRIEPIIDRSSTSKEFSFRYSLDSFHKHLRALKTLGEPIDSWDSISTVLFREKLNQANVRRDHVEFLNKYMSLGHMSLDNDQEAKDKRFILPHHAVITEDSVTTKVCVAFDGSARTSTGISFNDTLMVGPKLQDHLFAILMRFRSRAYVLTAEAENMYRQVRVHPDDAQFSLPTFNDAYDAWLGFRDLFHSLVHVHKHLRALKTLGEPINSWDSIFTVLFREKLNRANIRRDYVEFLNKYMYLGCMSLDNDQEAKDKRFILPHHAVINEDSVTTKVCVAFDGSARISTGISFNDALMVGRKLQDHLFAILMRFRSHTYVLTADAENMYRQFRVHPDDAQYQSILYREHASEPIRSYIIIAATYGTASASYLAINKLLKSAEDAEESFPLAVQVLRRDFNVNDLPTGANIIYQAIILRDELIALFKKDRFCLRNLISNYSSMFIEHHEQCSHMLLYPDAFNKTLGIRGNARKDYFFYRVNSSSHECITKKTIFSRIARLFDTLGLLGPIIVYANFLIQLLWKADVAWDKSIAIEIHSSWSAYQDQLSCIENLHFHRGLTNNTVISNCIVFVMLVKRFMAPAYIYAEFYGMHIRLNCSKSRVAPVKPLTLPRLELCASLLLSWLYCIVKPTIMNKINKSYIWSDSTIVLHWINTPAYCLKTFVSNRVAEIQAIATSCYWRHVSSQENSATLISRGQLPSEFMENTICFNDLPWLLQEISLWPKGVLVPELKSILPAHRVTSSRPFIHYGIENCEPFYIKKTRRNRDRLTVYVAVHTCMCTKEVHLELSYPTTEAFIASLRRLFSRKGKSVEIHSNNVTYFVGVRNKLNELYRIFSSKSHQSDILNFCSKERISWHFIPPRSLHFGEISEAAVKSFKHHLTRTVGDAFLTSEQLETCVIQIEVILNSRPISPMSSNHNDLLPLTPAHFLIGGSLTYFSQIDLMNTPSKCLLVWHYAPHLKQHFWTPWEKEYPQQLIKFRRPRSEDWTFGAYFGGKPVSSKMVSGTYRRRARWKERFRESCHSQDQGRQI